MNKAKIRVLFIGNALGVIIIAISVLIVFAMDDSVSNENISISSPSDNIQTSDTDISVASHQNSLSENSKTDKNSVDSGTSNNEISSAISSRSNSPISLPVSSDVTVKDYFISYDKLEFDLKTRLNIGVFVSPPPGFITDQNYRNIKNAGFDYVIGMTERTPENIILALDCAKQNGLGYIAQDPTIQSLNGKDKEFLAELLEEYGNHPALLGIMFRDEPSATLFPSHKALFEEYRRLYPNKLPFANLFPNYASPLQMGVDTYQQYIDDSIEIVNPTILSYDFYPFPAYGINPLFFNNLDIVRIAASKKGIPFWTFVQSMGWGGPGGMRNPDANELRWQINMNLAFGSRGMTYFCYWTPPASGENFGNACVDLDGNLTADYYEAKQINAEVRKYDAYLMKLKCEGIMVSGDADLGIGIESDLLKSYGPVKAVSGDAAVIGCFDGAEGKGVFAVNYSYTKNASVTFSIDEMISSGASIRSSESVVFASGSAITVSLKPGEGKLISFNK
ncbi:MAG: hypothetical protein ACYCYM_02070 [Saccharofermentanales bacterium]